MKTAPKDRPILILVEGSWIEAQWYHPDYLDKGRYAPVSLPSHGCGCCAEEDPEPEAWAELPT